MVLFVEDSPIVQGQTWEVGSNSSGETTMLEQVLVLPNKGIASWWKKREWNLGVRQVEKHWGPYPEGLVPADSLERLEQLLDRGTEHEQNTSLGLEVRIVHYGICTCKQIIMLQSDEDARYLTKNLKTVLLEVMSELFLRCRNWAIPVGILQGVETGLREFGNVVGLTVRRVGNYGRWAWRKRQVWLYRITCALLRCLDFLCMVKCP